MTKFHSTQTIPYTITQLAALPKSPFGIWPMPATITPNNFKYKSLSNWTFNIAVGCRHGCRFCYVPSAATIKQARQLSAFEVKNPDADWGDYVLLRSWDENKFLSSLRRAELTPASELKPDGNRAVIFCSTTDAYQTIPHPDPDAQQLMANHRQLMVRRSLELIRDHSTLNVRILTRSPLARTDFDLFHSFGQRLLFGMSLPTLRYDLSCLYEPKAPAPFQRLATLRAAREADLNVFVAMAPTFPQCNPSDLEATLKAVAELNPVTIFHEPVNIRAENVTRIQKHAEGLGIKLDTSAFSSRQSWASYALSALRTVEALAEKVGIADRLHLWPDSSLGSKMVLKSLPSPNRHKAWLQHWWQRISEWPGCDRSGLNKTWPESRNK